VAVRRTAAERLCGEFWIWNHGQVYEFDLRISEFDLLSSIEAVERLHGDVAYNHIRLQHRIRSK